jgi:hypothetical protein
MTLEWIACLPSLIYCSTVVGRQKLFRCKGSRLKGGEDRLLVELV